MQALNTCIRTSLSAGVFRDCEALTGLRAPGWNRRVNLISYPDALYSISIGRALLTSRITGKLIKAACKYRQYYVHKGTCYSVVALKREFGYVSDEPIQGAPDYPIVVSGYKRDQHLLMQTVTCTNATTWVSESKQITESLIANNDCFASTGVGDSTNWRSFIPDRQGVVRFQVNPESDPRSETHPSITHSLISALLCRFASDTKQDIVFIAGKPQHEYFTVKLYSRLCWIYDTT